MIEIAVCEDEQPIREYIKRLTEQSSDVHVSTFERGEDLLKEKTVFDIILLDISLDLNEKDAINGIEVAKMIREKSGAIIIFITALKEYVFEAFDVGAFHYLLKPIDEQKFEEVIGNAIGQIKKRQVVEPLVIKSNGGYIQIPVNNIIYAENEARKIVIYTKNMDDDSYSFYEKMEDLERRLGDRFFRSHRGYLVNLAEVRRYDTTTIILKNGVSVYLAKQKYNDFVAAYMNYLRKV